MIGPAGPMPGFGSDHTGTCPCDGCARRNDLEEAIELRASDLSEQGYDPEWAWAKAEDELDPEEEL